MRYITKATKKNVNISRIQQINLIFDIQIQQKTQSITKPKQNYFVFALDQIIIRINRWQYYARVNDFSIFPRNTF